MSYTERDIRDAGLFAEANNRIRLVRAAYEKAKHLVSHLKITIRDATDDDYYRPSALKHACKVVDIEIPKELCEMLSCNPTKPDGMCNPNDKASYYYVGDDGYDIQCQPACFNTANKATFNDDGERAPDTPMLNFHDGQCRIVNSTMISYLEKTFFRSDTHYENRLNDMPTGFSRYVDNDNRYGSGMQYRTNATYCKYYDRTLMEDGSCDMTIWEKVLDSVIGMSLINTVKSSIRMLTNDNKPFDPPTNLPKLPDTIPEVYTLDGWKANVNTDFVLPDLIDTTPQRPRVATRTTTTSSHHDERRAREVAIDEHSGETGEGMSEFMKKRYNIPHRRTYRAEKSKKTGKYANESGNVSVNDGNERKMNEKDDSVPRRAKRVKRSDDESTADNDGDDNDDKWWEKMGDVLLEMLHALVTDPEMWANIGINVAIDGALDSIKSMCKRIVEKLAKYATKEITKIGGEIGSRVLSTALRGLSVKMVTDMTIRIASRTAVMLAKITAAAASVIGWLLIGTMLLDLLFTFWDPYGYKNLFPPDMPRVLMNNGQFSFRQALGSAKSDFPINMFLALILSPDEIMSINMLSLIDRMIYLDALVVNSEGSRIDKGDSLRMDGGSNGSMERAQNAAMAKRVRFDPISYEAYNRDFLNRVRSHRTINRVSVAVALSAVIVTLLGARLLGLFLVICVLIAFAINRAMLQNDDLVDAIRQIQFQKQSPYSLRATATAPSSSSEIIL